VVTRLRDEVKKAKATNDWKVAQAVSNDVAAALGPLFPNGSFAEFSKYNIGLEKARMDAAGWAKAGPCRPPYHIIPPEYLKGAEESGRQWAKYCALYDQSKAA
jgi:trans-o-hydroxybenzylidenepyruvate hydratase-aldolase